MRFILNKDRLELEDIEVIKSGSVSYYEAEVEYDDSWKDLTIEAVVVHSQNNILDEVGNSIAVINNKMYIDQKLRGTYCIGFVGYRIEEEKKIYQVSTNLKSVYFDKGAGEIETRNPELPTLTEWERYIAQIQEMLKNIGGISGGAIDDVLVDGKSVVENRVAKIDLNSLEKTLQDILAIIQSGELGKNQISDIEQLIVSYLENKTIEEVER